VFGRQRPWRLVLILEEAPFSVRAARLEQQGPTTK